MAADGPYMRPASKWLRIRLLICPTTRIAALSLGCSSSFIQIHSWIMTEANKAGNQLNGLPIRQHRLMSSNSSSRTRIPLKAIRGWWWWWRIRWLVRVYSWVPRCMSLADREIVVIGRDLTVEIVGEQLKKSREYVEYISISGDVWDSRKIFIRGN